MSYLPNILFAIALVLGIGFFVKNIKKLTRNIKLGKDVDVSDNKSQRWKNMAMTFRTVRIATWSHQTELSSAKPS